MRKDYKPMMPVSRWPLPRPPPPPPPPPAGLELSVRAGLPILGLMGANTPAPLLGYRKKHQKQHVSKSFWLLLQTVKLFLSATVNN